jgi:hypothetical protein
MMRPFDRIYINKTEVDMDRTWARRRRQGRRGHHPMAHPAHFNMDEFIWNNRLPIATGRSGTDEAASTRQSGHRVLLLKEGDRLTLAAAACERL